MVTTRASSRACMLVSWAGPISISRPRPAARPISCGTPPLLQSGAMTDQTHVTRLPAFSRRCRLPRRGISAADRATAGRTDRAGRRAPGPPAVPPGCAEPQPEGPTPAAAALVPTPVAAGHRSGARRWRPPRPAILAGRKVEMERVLRPLLSGHPMIVRVRAGRRQDDVAGGHRAARAHPRAVSPHLVVRSARRLEQTLALALDMPSLAGSRRSLARAAPACPNGWTRTPC